MIVKPDLAVGRVVAYTARPIAWAVLWSVVVPVAYATTDDSRWTIPFAPVGAIGAALAIFVAFRNNVAFARWNEGRVAWQTVLVASRVVARQVIASADDAVAAGRVEPAAAEAFRTAVVRRVAAFALLLGGRVGRPIERERLRSLIGDDEVTARVESSVNPADELIGVVARDLKSGIRSGALGQFDPIALEPQLAALQGAAGVVERLATTPTPRQYDYFTKRFIEAFAVLLPFAVVGLVPDAVWWAIPLSLLPSAVFVMMAVTGAANDEPFRGAVTDVPVHAITVDVERELRDRLGEAVIPPPVSVVDGYLW